MNYVVGSRKQPLLVWNICAGYVGCIAMLGLSMLQSVTYLWFYKTSVGSDFQARSEARPQAIQARRAEYVERRLR